MYPSLRNKMSKPISHNVTGGEKWLSIGGGLLLIGKGLRRPGVFGLFNMVLGASAIYRGMRGYCPAKQQLRELRQERRPHLPKRTG